MIPVQCIKPMLNTKEENRRLKHQVEFLKSNYCTAVKFNHIALANTLIDQIVYTEVKLLALGALIDITV